MWVEHCLRNLILAIKLELWPTLQTKTEDIDKTIWLIHIEFSALTVRGQQDFRLRWGPIDRCHSSSHISLVLKDKLLLKFATLF